MTHRYQQVALGDAIAGMTLSDPVLDSKGNILLPQGITLTDRMIASLQRHQIDTLAVLRTDVSDDDAQAARDQQVARVAHLFRVYPALSDEDVPEAPETPAAIAQLHRYVLRFRSGSAS